MTGQRTSERVADDLETSDMICDNEVYTYGKLSMFVLQESRFDKCQELFGNQRLILVGHNVVKEIIHCKNGNPVGISRPFVF